MPSELGYHAFLERRIGRDEAVAGLLSGANRLQFAVTEVEEAASPRIAIARSSEPPIQIQLVLSPARQQLMTQLPDEVFSSYGAMTVGELFFELSVELNVILGRTFREGFHAAVAESEIESALEYVEWFQFLGPAIVDRWGLERLERGPFWRVDEAPHGACGLWLRQEPLAALEREAVRAAAEYLGLRLRPHRVLESGGRSVKLNWP